LQEDLTITRVVRVTSTGSDHKVGEVFQVHVYVKNIGTLEAWDVTTGLYVDTKPVEVVAPTLTRDIRQFSPGAEKRCIFYVKINEPGEHKIGAYVDPIEHIHEYNEFNNQHLGIITNVEGKPDLVIDNVSFSPNPVNPFQSFDINVTIRNDGNYLSGESKLGIRAPLSSRYSEITVYSLEAGASVILNKSYANGFPFSGSHRFNVEADYLNEVTEYNEDNNTGTGVLNVN
jgi:subtilase family serine protease